MSSTFSLFRNLDFVGAGRAPARGLSGVQGTALSVSGCSPRSSSASTRPVGVDALDTSQVYASRPRAPNQARTSASVASTSFTRGRSTIARKGCGVGSLRSTRSSRRRSSTSGPSMYANASSASSCSVGVIAGRSPARTSCNDLEAAALEDRPRRLLRVHDERRRPPGHRVVPARAHERAVGAAPARRTGSWRRRREAASRARDRTRPRDGLAVDVREPFSAPSGASPRVGLVRLGALPGRTLLAEVARREHDLQADQEVGVRLDAPDQTPSTATASCSVASAVKRRQERRPGVARAGRAQRVRELA